MQIGVPFLAWTGIYWVFTMITGDSWDQAWSLLWNYALYGYYQLYFVVVLLALYARLPGWCCGRSGRRSHHGLIMLGSLLFALLLAADLHYTSSFGVVGQWTARHRLGVALGAQPDHVPGAVRGRHSGRPALRRGPRASWSAGTAR